MLVQHRDAFEGSSNSTPLYTRTGTIEGGEQAQRQADVERLLPVFANTGIERRYSCVPIEWYAEPHGWKDCTALYVQHAVQLFETVAPACLAEAKLAPDGIDAIVTVSTTRVATPSLDALLVERMGLRRDIKRLPIFGFGCAGGVIGLARAGALAAAMPGAKVLFLAVELCALTFRRDDLSKSNVVATALFGDGAAGAIVSTAGNGPALGASGEHTWPGLSGHHGLGHRRRRAEADLLAAHSDTGRSGVRPRVA